MTRRLPRTPGGLASATVVIAGLLGPAAPSWARDQGPELSGFVGSEVRVFFEEPKFDGQFDDPLAGVQPSLLAEPELSYDSQDRRHQFNLAPFLRLDARDGDRSHVDLREGYWRYVDGDWEVLLGVNRVFWGVTESRHLVNVINQIDAVEDIDEEDFLGQPMVNLATQQDWGRLDLFVMPGFRERTFPGRNGRLRPGIPVDEDAAQYDSELGRGQPDTALRYSHFLGDFDIGAYYFYGNGREPRLVPGGRGTRLEPRYDLIHQGGLDLQYTDEAWLWKLEAIVREGQGDNFGAVVAGVEYTFFQAFETAADLGLLSEFLYDGRDDDDAPPTAFDEDVFFGTRLALNDVQDTTALLGAVVDVQDGTTALFFEAERRLGDSWKLELEVRAFLGVDDGNVTRNFENDDFALLRLSYFF